MYGCQHNFNWKIWKTGELYFLFPADHCVLWLCDSCGIIFAKSQSEYIVNRTVYFNVLHCRKIFDDCRENLASYFKDREPTLWTFHPKVVFERFQGFVDRLETIKVVKPKKIGRLTDNLNKILLKDALLIVFSLSHTLFTFCLYPLICRFYCHCLSHLFDIFIS
jgi:hypothetical protein